ncbi:MAG: hypothetical protein ABIP51_10495 [Bacteroidia bacterium]
MAHIVLAPHLDDEVIGCFSIWDKIDTVVYYTKDYRIIGLRNRLETFEDNNENGFHIPEFEFSGNFDFSSITEKDTIYIPSKFDFHPLHKVVRNFGLGLPAKKMFYSVEMNVPWLEEEDDSDLKLELLKKLYPKEDLFLTNAKYYLFKSIKEFDDISYRRVFSRFHLDFKLFIQEFSSKENFYEIELKINEITSKTGLALGLETFNQLIQNAFPNRLIKLITEEKIIE